MSRVSPYAKCVRLVYLSRMFAVDDPKWVINEILRDSHINNERQGVTGALIFDRGDFGQVLEGPRSAVLETFLRIEADPRHFRVTVVEHCDISERSFPGCSMGYMPAMEGPNPYGQKWEIPGPDSHFMTGGDAFARLQDAMLNDRLQNRAA
jgi:hypothetical protein